MTTATHHLHPRLHVPSASPFGHIAEDSLDGQDVLTTDMFRLMEIPAPPCRDSSWASSAAATTPTTTIYWPCLLFSKESQFQKVKRRHFDILGAFDQQSAIDAIDLFLAGHMSDSSADEDYDNDDCGDPPVAVLLGPKCFATYRKRCFLHPQLDQLHSFNYLRLFAQRAIHVEGAMETLRQVKSLFTLAQLPPQIQNIKNNGTDNLTMQKAVLEKKTLCSSTKNEKTNPQQQRSLISPKKDEKAPANSQVGRSQAPVTLPDANETTLTFRGDHMAASQTAAYTDNLSRAVANTAVQSLPRIENAASSALVQGRPSSFANIKNHHSRNSSIQIAASSNVPTPPKHPASQAQVVTTAVQESGAQMSPTTRRGEVFVSPPLAVPGKIPPGAAAPPNTIAVAATAVAGNPSLVAPRVAANDASPTNCGHLVPDVCSKIPHGDNIPASNDESYNLPQTEQDSPLIVRRPPILRAMDLLTQPLPADNDPQDNTKEQQPQQPQHHEDYGEEEPEVDFQTEVQRSDRERIQDEVELLEREQAMEESRTPSSNGGGLQPNELSAILDEGENIDFSLPPSSDVEIPFEDQYQCPIYTQASPLVESGGSLGANSVDNSHTKMMKLSTAHGSSSTSDGSEEENEANPPKTSNNFDNKSHKEPATGQDTTTSNFAQDLEHQLPSQRCNTTSSYLEKLEKSHIGRTYDLQPESITTEVAANSAETVLGETTEPRSTPSTRRGSKSRLVTAARHHHPNKLSPSNSREGRSTENDPPQYKGFEDVKGLFEKAGFRFQPQFYCVPEENSSDENNNSGPTLGEDRFDTEEAFREYLYEKRVGDDDHPRWDRHWGTAEKEEIRRWVVGPPGHKQFHEVQKLLEKGGFHFALDLYCLPGGNPKTNEESKLGTHYFHTEEEFRKHLCQNGVEAERKNCWDEEDKKAIHQWVHMEIVRSCDQKYGLPYHIEIKDSRPMLTKLGFELSVRGSGSDHNFYVCYPGVKKKGDLGVDTFSNIGDLKRHLSRFGLPENCAFREVSSMDLLSLEVHLSLEEKQSQTL